MSCMSSQICLQESLILIGMVFLQWNNIRPKQNFKGSEILH